MNNRNIPAAGEFYRHFKGNLYQVIGVAKHSETGEKMVVYQALYGDFCLYTRPLEMFLSLVDKVKYPEADQEYRFEKCMPGEDGCGKSVTKSEEKKYIGGTEVKERAVKEKETEVKVENTGKDTDSEETVREEILLFLDAEGAGEKLEVLRQLRKNMDENLLTTIELSMDLLPNERESMERRYELVEQTLEKRVRFEGGRLR